MKLFNTMTRQKEEFVPLTPGQVKMYCCGPTVYNFIHVGNARPMILFDVLRRYLEYRGYDVTFVQNFTDVDDKIIKRANEEGTTVPGDFREVHRGVLQGRPRPGGPGRHHPPQGHREHPARSSTWSRPSSTRATRTPRGATCTTAPRSLPTTASSPTSPLRTWRPAPASTSDDVKEDPLDFALWKAAKPGEPYWDSPWGQGRPGWHIECSAMSRPLPGRDHRHPLRRRGPAVPPPRERDRPVRGRQRLQVRQLLAPQRLY